MNDYKRLEMINDRHWTNITKCDILAKYAGLIEADKNIRDKGLDIKLNNEKRYVHDLKKENRTYRELTKKTKNQNNDSLLSGVQDRILVERYKSLRPDGIKLITEGNIFRITHKSNRLIEEINKKNYELEDIQASLLDINENIIEDTLKQEIIEIRKIDKKLALVHMYNKKTKLMVDFAKHNLSIYDTIIEQLRNDVGLIGKNIVKALEIGTFFKEDEANFIQNYLDEKTCTENHINKDMVRINQLNSIMDSLERSRKTLMNDRTVSESAKAFYAELPWAAIKKNDDQLSNSSSKDSRVALPNKDDDWINNILKFGVKYLIDEDEQNELLANCKNDSNSSSIDYKLPENIMDYITFSDTLPTKNEIAINYILQTLEYNNSTTDDIINTIEYTKSSLVQLNQMKAVRSILFNLLFKQNYNIQETIENFNRVSYNEIEFEKRTKMLKSVIDGQHKKISDLEITKHHYLKLLNDMYFYLNNVRNILKKVKFSDDDIKRYSDLNFAKGDNSLGISNTKLSAFLADLKYMISEINGKIRWCKRIIPDDFDPNKLNLARAIYMYKVRVHIENDCLKKENKHINASKKKVSITDFNKNPEPILTREDTKKLAEEIVTYFNEKDQDRLKTKRHPISFRKNFK